MASVLNALTSAKRTTGSIARDPHTAFRLISFCRTDFMFGDSGCKGTATGWEGRSHVLSLYATITYGNITTGTRSCICPINDHKSDIVSNGNRLYIADNKQFIRMCFVLGQDVYRKNTLSSIVVFNSLPDRLKLAGLGGAGMMVDNALDAWARRCKNCVLPYRLRSRLVP